MNTLLLGLLFMGAAPAQRGSAPASDEAWDLRWMIGPPGGAPTAPPPPATARLQRLGRSLYRARCAPCHGAEGDGQGPAAARLPVRPTSFAAGLYKLRSTPPGSIPTDEDLFRTLTRGVHGTPMLPWVTLTEEQRWALVFHIKSFSTRFSEERPRPPLVIPPRPREDAALRRRGAGLYARLRCAACHGDDGAGKGRAADLYQDAAERQVPIRDFTRGRFIRGAEMEDIYLTLRTGLEGTPMPSYFMLTNDETWALAAYVRSLVRELPLHEMPPAGTRAEVAPAAPAGKR